MTETENLMKRRIETLERGIERRDAQLREAAALRRQLESGVNWAIDFFRREQYHHMNGRGTEIALEHLQRAQDSIRESQ